MTSYGDKLKSRAKLEEKKSMKSIFRWNLDGMATVHNEGGPRAWKSFRKGTSRCW